MPDKIVFGRRRIWWSQLIAYLLIIALAAIGFWQIQSSQQDVHQSQDCTEKFLAAAVQSLNDRTTTTNDAVRADRVQNSAWAHYVHEQLHGAQTGHPTSIKDQIKAVQDYFRKLHHYLELSRRASSMKPYPTKEDYRSCLNK